MSRFTNEEKEHKLKLIEKTRNKITSMTCEFQPYVFDVTDIIEKIRQELILEFKTKDIDDYLAFRFIEYYNDNKIPVQFKQTFLEKFRNCKNQCRKETKILLGKFSKVKDILPKQIKEFINEKIITVTDFIISNSRVLRI